MQAKHSDDDGGEDGDDQVENILFFEKIRTGITLYLLKIRLLSLSNVTFH